MIKKLGLKNRILVGLLGASLLAIGACLFCILSFQQLEDRMQMINEVFVPSVKILTQVESQFFLFEQDLDRALVDANMRPKYVDIQSMDSKLNALYKLQRRGEYDFASPTMDLRENFSQFNKIVEAALADPKRLGEEVHGSALSKSRADLRHQLRSLARVFEQEERMQAVILQNRLSRSAIIVTFLLAFSLMVSAYVIYMSSQALAPLEPLTKLIQRISERGFIGDEAVVLQIAQGRSDEVGLLARDFSLMVASLRDRALKIEEQKKNLERAHLDMAKQNLALRQTQAKLVHQEKLALVGKLSAQVAHEVRNPLNAMGLHLDFLESQAAWKSPDALASLQSLRKELDRLASLTESYLNLARAPKLEPTMVSLNDLAKESSELYQPWLEGQKIKLIVELKSQLVVRVDRQQVMQVIGNLIKNAAESFAEANPHRCIRIFTRDLLRQGLVELVCEDNGSGIAKAVESEVFSPFFTTKAMGTGIGLAHSKQLIEAHGGSISFSSSEGQGTIFTVSFPMGGVANA